MSHLRVLKKKFNNQKNIMRNANKLKILIIALTSVLQYSNSTDTILRKGIVRYSSSTIHQIGNLDNNSSYKKDVNQDL